LKAEGIGLPDFRKAIEFQGARPRLRSHRFKARHPDELRGAIADAFAVDGPAIVDCVVTADELRNIPHIELYLGHAMAPTVISRVLRILFAGIAVLACPEVSFGAEPDGGPSVS
jgi:pyruvate dehydrogenase (quinone)